MNESFSINLNNETLEVRELNLKNYCGAFEIWKKGELQFIIVHNINISQNPAWSVDHSESSNVSQEYIDAVGNQIDSYLE